jgi:hypothetical protein
MYVDELLIYMTYFNMFDLDMVINDNHITNIDLEAKELLNYITYNYLSLHEIDYIIKYNYHMDIKFTSDYVDLKKLKDLEDLYEVYYSYDLKVIALLYYERYLLKRFKKNFMKYLILIGYMVGYIEQYIMSIEFFQML